MPGCDDFSTVIVGRGSWMSADVSGGSSPATSPLRRGRGWGVVRLPATFLPSSGRVKGGRLRSSRQRRVAPLMRPGVGKTLNEPVAVPLVRLMHREPLEATTAR